MNSKEPQLREREKIIKVTIFFEYFIILMKYACWLSKSFGTVCLTTKYERKKDDVGKYHCVFNLSNVTSF